MKMKMNDELNERVSEGAGERKASRRSLWAIFYIRQRNQEEVLPVLILLVWSNV